jgi:hypothetical protein
MRRWAFHILAGLSLLLALAAAVMWVRSYSRVERVQYTRLDARQTPRPHTQWAITYLESCVGGLQLRHMTAVSQGLQAFARAHQDPDGYHLGLRWLVDDDDRQMRYPTRGWVTAHTHLIQCSIAGFEINKSKWGPADNPNTSKSITVPHWFLVLVGMPLPVFTAMVAVRRRRRIRNGMCVNCGYDLRASKERCPECGEAIRQPIVNTLPEVEELDGAKEPSATNL